MEVVMSLLNDEGVLKWKVHSTSVPIELVMAKVDELKNALIQDKVLLTLTRLQEEQRKQLEDAALADRIKNGLKRF